MVIHSNDLFWSVALHRRVCFAASQQRKRRILEDTKVTDGIAHIL